MFLAINADKPHLWKADIALSVDHYNAWFLAYAPRAFRDTRAKTVIQVQDALAATDNLKSITPTILHAHPSLIPILRMAAAPPIARDRLIGLANVSPNLVRSMELRNRIPPLVNRQRLDDDLLSIATLLKQLIDDDIFPWLGQANEPSTDEIIRAATIVADRLCGAVTDPIVRNAQEQRQLTLLADWLVHRGYTRIDGKGNVSMKTFPPGNFALRLNVPITQSGRGQTVNIPIDVVVKPLTSSVSALPLLIEAKSAGDFTNTNKRRKEEATKMAQLQRTYGPVQFVLFLCGYFDSGYLGYEAAEGIDWMWEHRVDDLALLGL